MSISIMPFVMSGTNKACMVRIDGDLIYDNVTELHSKISARICKKDTIVLDLGGIESCDAAGIQLLLAFISEMNERDITITVDSIGPVLVDQGERLGISFKELLHMKQ